MWDATNNRPKDWVFLSDCVGLFFNVLLSVFLWGGNWSRVRRLVLDACLLCYRRRRDHLPLISPHFEPWTFMNWRVLRWVLGRFNTSCLHLPVALVVVTCWRDSLHFQDWQNEQVSTLSASLQCANRPVAMFNQQEVRVNLAKATRLSCLLFLSAVYCWCLLPV